MENTLTKNNSGWSCTCPDYTYRKVECKHINAVRLWLKLKEKMESADVFDLLKAFEDVSLDDITDEIKKTSPGSC